MEEERGSRKGCQEQMRQGRVAGERKIRKT